MDSVKRSNDANPKLLHFSTTQKVQLNSLKEVRPYLELEPSLKEKLGRGFQQARGGGGKKPKYGLDQKASAQQHTLFKCRLDCPKGMQDTPKYFPLTLSLTAQSAFCSHFPLPH